MNLHTLVKLCLISYDWPETRSSQIPRSSTDLKIEELVDNVHLSVANKTDRVILWGDRKYVQSLMKKL